ncbi:MAG TPA: ATP-binding protein [Eoetvoesiella sp.]
MLFYASLAHADDFDANKVASGTAVLSQYISMFEEPSGKMGLEEVSALPIGPASGFVSLAERPLPSGPSTSTWWVNLHIVNTGSRPRSLHLALSPSTNFRELDFHIHQNGRWRHIRDGQAVPLSQHSDPELLPSVALTLEPGEQVRLLARAKDGPPKQLKFFGYSEAGYRSYIDRHIVWDGLLFGGLLALGWSGFMIAVFTRNSAFLLLSALSVVVVVYETARRGYAKFYLWPEAAEWSYRSAYVMGHLSLALFMWFVLEVARQEKIGLPWRRTLIGWAVFEIAMAANSAFGNIYTVTKISVYSTPLYSLSLLATAIVLIKMRTPTRKLMLLVAIYALAHLTLGSLEKHGMLPAIIDHMSMGGVGINPVIALAGFYLNLTLLAGWIAHVGRQRRSAYKELARLQEDENTRLNEEVARQTKALNQALKYADEKNHQKTEILGYIGHDLRAPLATIVGYARLLSAGHTVDRDSHIQAIERSANYQLGLIDELLNYAKTELKPLALTPAPVQMSAFLDDIVQHATSLGRQQANRFHCEVANRLPCSMVFDRRRMQQTLLNLLSNAAKFTHNGTISLNIDAIKSAKSWRMRFTVSDSGIGIDADQQSIIFNAFEQALPRSGGVGLGLFIAQSIIRSMGSELHLQSKCGEGSSFSFQIAIPAVGNQTINWTMPCLAQHPVLAEMDNHPVQHAFPPAHARMELAVLARDGHLTDIEHWLGHMCAKYPACADFFREVRRALSRLDLQKIENLALAQA